MVARNFLNYGTYNELRLFLLDEKVNKTNYSFDNFQKVSDNFQKLQNKVGVTKGGAKHFTFRV